MEFGILRECGSSGMMMGAEVDEGRKEKSDSR